MKHPGEETLLAAASGRLDRPHRLVVETHLELCPACRRSVAELATPGGWLLRGLPDEAPSPGLWGRLERQLAAPPPVDRLAPEIPLPEAIRRELALGERPRWHSLLLNGGRMAQLARDVASGAWLCLGFMPGGRRFPRHEHLGYEHAVVLSGGYEDERGEFVAGDYAVYEPGSAHGPDTLDGDPCWILFRLEGTVRFAGWRGQLQRLFT